jgi:hypothetical protein
MFFRSKRLHERIAQWLKDLHRAELDKITLLGEGYILTEVAYRRELRKINRRIERINKLLKIAKAF